MLIRENFPPITKNEASSSRLALWQCPDISLQPAEYSGSEHHGAADGEENCGANMGGDDACYGNGKGVEAKRRDHQHAHQAPQQVTWSLLLQQCKCQHGEDAIAEFQRCPSALSRRLIQRRE